MTTTPQAVQVTIDYVTASAIDVEQISRRTALGNDHDARLRDALLKAGAEEIKGPQITVTDDTLGGLSLSATAGSPSNALIQIKPHINKDRSLTVMLTLQQNLPLAGANSLAMGSQSLATICTFQPGQTLRLGGYHRIDQNTKASSELVIFATAELSSLEPIMKPPIAANVLQR